MQVILALVEYILKSMKIIIEKSVRILSQKLTEIEQRYNIISKKLLAITCALQKLRNYLLGRSFTLYTDSNVVK